MNIKMMAALGAAAVMLSTAGMATASTVNFSFTNNIGSTAGTVTGHLDGLVDNATSAATGVWIDSYPFALAGGANASYPAPFDVLAWTGVSPNENSFTLVNGVLTGGAFSISGANGVIDQFFLNSDCCTSGDVKTNYLDIGTFNGLQVWADGAINTPDGATFSAAEGGGAVPEPASWAMMIVGFGTVGAAMRRRRMVPALAA